MPPHLDIQPGALRGHDLRQVLHIASFRVEIDDEGTQDVSAMDDSVRHERLATTLNRVQQRFVQIVQVAFGWLGPE